MNGYLSPCVGRCCLNEADLCIGCLRSLSEITEWSQASDSRKKMILDNIQLRANSKTEDKK